MSKRTSSVNSSNEEQNSGNAIDDHRKPRCPTGDRPGVNWKEETVDETTLLFRSPCSWCYPEQNEPDVGDPMVRSQGQYSGDSIHLPGDIYTERHEKVENGSSSSE